METSKLRETYEEMKQQLLKTKLYYDKLVGAVEVVRLLIEQDEKEQRDAQAAAATTGEDA